KSTCFGRWILIMTLGQYKDSPLNMFIQVMYVYLGFSYPSNLTINSLSFAQRTSSQTRYITET
ncbi:hypothetical protein LMH81_26495, partial [Vibrio lentus]|uniref:hypothetical protein n=1 Tax=Vibrio lentus TaxID=136468 RepID=UPI001E30A1DA